MLVDTVNALSRACDGQDSDQDQAEPGRSQAAALAYQPIVALQTGLVCGLAMVMRRRAAVPAQRGERAPPIVGSVLAQACIEARYFPGLRLSVRISGRQLESGELLGQIDSALATSGLPAPQLDLEFSEIGRFDLAAHKLAVLLALRERGIGVVLEGFGIGESSLPLLRKLPFSAVKLDHRLIHALPLDPRVCERIGTLLETRRAAGIVCLAEGVETLAQRDFLSRRGCDAASGPLYSRPVVPERLAALLDYGVDTCPRPHSGSETRDDRAVPH